MSTALPTRVPRPTGLIVRASFSRLTPTRWSGTRSRSWNAATMAARARGRGSTIQETASGLSMGATPLRRGGAPFAERRGCAIPTDPNTVERRGDVEPALHYPKDFTPDPHRGLRIEDNGKLIVMSESGWLKGPVVIGRGWTLVQGKVDAHGHIARKLPTYANHLEATLERAEARNAADGWVQLTENDKTTIQVASEALDEEGYQTLASDLHQMHRQLSTTEGDDE